MTLNVPYSDQYVPLTREGHESPPPTFGAPTLVWHLAISPHWPARNPEQSGVEKLHRDLANQYQDTRSAFFAAINRLLVALHGGASRSPYGKLNLFNPEAVPGPWTEQTAPDRPFLVVDPPHIQFTLWWHDDDRRAYATPSEDALRVLVQAVAHRDFATISFYLDAGKPWDRPALTSVEQVVGTRRELILAAMEHIHGVARPRLEGADALRNVDREILPETGVSEQEAASLLAASRYLYSSVWDEFCNAFAIKDLGAILGEGDSGKAITGAGRVFANLRGLVITTSGLPDDTEAAAHPGSSGAQPFPRFAGNGGIHAAGSATAREPNEANAVVKAYWPFVRRIIPFADQREFIACGVMRWRALYITALGSRRAFDWRDEGAGVQNEIPAQQLPEQLRDTSGAYDSQSGKHGEGPLRYLILTKGEPHRRQIGRIVERINAMGTTRLVALRDWNIIRDASTHIQLRGLELDRIMSRWSSESSAIRKRYADPTWFVISEAKRRDKRVERLQALQTSIERDLIQLSAALDETGAEAVHGLHFRINRSRYYVEEFESLLASLHIGNIDTWVAYDQFVARGLRPAFNFIDGVGKRLAGLRNRLQSVLEGIETSALVIQTSATRSNTAQLRKLANRFRWQNALIVAGGALWAYMVERDNETWTNLLSEVQTYVISGVELLMCITSWDCIRSWV